MKKLQLIAWIIFAIGFIFKFLHFPGASFSLTLGALLLFIHVIIFTIKNVKENLTVSFLHLSVTFWTIHLLFRIQYWNCGPNILGYPLLFIIPTCLTITYLILNFRNTTRFKIPQILLIAYFLFSIWLANTHSYKIYYFYYLNEITQTENRNENYLSWDKYSWFLYISDKQDEAIQANLKAQQIIEDKMKGSQNRELSIDLRMIKRHNQLIRDKNWIDFRK